MEKKPSERINEILEDHCYGDDRFLALAIRIYLDEQYEKQQVEVANKSREEAIKKAGL